MRIFTTICVLPIFFALSACVDGGEAAGPRTSVARPGDTVMRVERSEVMPNAFGGDDIFGRKRPTGTTIVTLVSTSRGVATFRRQDVTMISAKTTLNTAPTVITTGKRSTDVIVLPSMVPNDKIGGVTETSFKLSATSGGNMIAIDGHKLVVLSVGDNQVSYSAN